MARDSAYSHEPTPVSYTRLWIGVMAAPIAWSIAGLLGYAMTARRCDLWISGLGAHAVGDARVATIVVSVVMALLSALGLIVAVRSYRLAGNWQPPTDRLDQRRAGADEVRAHGPALAWERTRFMSLSGILISALLLVSTILFVIPAVVTDACREAM